MDISDIEEYISPFIGKPINAIGVRCPLYYFASNRFNRILLNKGYELVHPAGFYFHRSEKEFVCFEKNMNVPNIVHFSTTLSFTDVYKVFDVAIKEVFKNKYLQLEGKTLEVQVDLKAPEFEQIKHTISNTVLSTLENSLLHYESFCDRYSKNHLSNTLGLLLYGPPGYGKSFILRSFLKKLLNERGFTIVHLQQTAIAHISLYRLLESCKTLFPCVLYLEDIDLAFYDRSFGESATGELLEKLEGLNQAEDVVIIATSNSVDIIDKALLRPGRFDYLIELQLPSYEAKKLVLSEYMKDIDFKVPESIVDKLIKVSETFAELKGGFQHTVRTYMGTGGFPDLKEIEDITYGWKETRTNGLIRSDKRKVGII